MFFSQIAPIATIDTPRQQLLLQAFNISTHELCSDSNYVYAAVTYDKTNFRLNATIRATMMSNFNVSQVSLCNLSGDNGARLTQVFEIAINDFDTVIAAQLAAASTSATASAPTPSFGC